MKLFYLHLKKVIFLSIFLLLAGCSSINVRGHFVSDSAIEKINAERLNKEAIVKLIGNPNYIPEYSQNTWYYIQRSISKTAWLQPKVAEQRIVEIKFTEKGDFIAAQLLTDTNEQIALDSKYTKTKGTEQTNIQKFVKNIGRFQKKNNDKRRRKKSK